MIEKIISGFQTGADIAGIDAAIAADFPYEGWIPKGRRTEDGPLDPAYLAREMKTAGYPSRTRRNIIDSDGTVIFTHGALSGGSQLTRKLAREEGRPWLHIDFKKVTIDEAKALLTSWTEAEGIKRLNCAGRSASRDPEIYGKVYQVIYELINS